MSRFLPPAALATGVLLWVVGLAPAFIGPLELLIPLPSPGDLVSLIDAITRKDSAIQVDVRMGELVGQGKLLIARSRVDVALERTSVNWRGRVEAQLKVPTDITYSVDLTQIRANCIRLDVHKRELIVLMPTPEVEAVTPHLSQIQSDSTFKKARFRFLDRSVTQQLYNAMLTHDYQARARSVGEARIPEVREQGRIVLQLFLQALLDGTRPGVKVVVE